MPDDNDNNAGGGPSPTPDGPKVAGTSDGLAAGAAAAIASAMPDLPQKPRAKRPRKARGDAAKGAAAPGGAMPPDPMDALDSALDAGPEAAAAPSEPPPDRPDGDDTGEHRSRRTASGEWTWDGAPDPCPVRALGYAEGLLYFVSAKHEYRQQVPASSLPRIGLLTELFGGDLTWPLRHFEKSRKRGEGGVPVDAERLAVELIRMCGQAGQFDTSILLRGPGTYCLPDGRVIIHCGDVLLIDAVAQPPGLRAGGALYRSWAALQRPALVREPDGKWRYDGASADVGRDFVAALGEWRWSRPATEPELFAGGIAHAMLGDAVSWHCHMFVRAQSGAGKSTLLRLADALLGASSHGVFDNVTAAYIQGQLTHQARAAILDEYENDTDETRLKRLTEMIRLMSDSDGGHGGRGSGSGQTREIRLSGSVIMAATVREEMRPQDLNRITMLRLVRLYDGPRADDAEKLSRAQADDRIQALIKDCKRHSPGVRARMIGRIGLYRENLARARASLLGWGVSPRDSTQLGHLIAGYWTLTGDEPADDAQREAARKYLEHLPSAADDVDDDQLDQDVRGLLNRLFGAEDHLTWSGGSRQTIGQLIGQGRGDGVEAPACRKRLLPLGLRLVKGEEHWTWKEAQLAVANMHTGLLKVFEGTPYRGGKWSQILEDWAATSILAPTQFAGVKSRARLIPPQYLPTIDD